MADKTSFSTLTTKQKVIGALVVVILGFIIYEVIGLFSSGDKTVDQTMKPLPQTASSAQPKRMLAASSVPGGSAAPNPTAPQEAPVQTSITSVNAVTLAKENSEVQKQQLEQQQTYLDSVNQLQLLKIKREIAETNQAIAAARLATETANKNMSDLLTQPTLPQAPGGSFMTRPPNMPGSVQAVESGTTETVTPTKQPVLDIPFTVISVSMKFSRWNAVLGYDNKLYSVTIGDTLFDGSTVASISKNGVVLSKDGKKRKISIQATI